MRKKDANVGNWQGLKIPIIGENTARVNDLSFVRCKTAVCPNCSERMNIIHHHTNMNLNTYYDTHTYLCSCPKCESLHFFQEVIDVFDTI